MKALISVLFLVIASNSFAKDMRYYDVEIVIVENLSEKEKNSENWPIQVNLTRPEKTVELGKSVLSEWLPQGVDLRSSYKVLKSRNYKLTDQVKKISDSKTQRVIYHFAWRQPGLNKHQSLPIYFKRDVPAAPQIQQESTEIAAIDESNNLNTPDSILEGVLRVTLSRFLHLEAELAYREKVPDTVDSDNPFSVLDNENQRSDIQNKSVVHLKQKRRRIRSNELHYIDHPVLGILVNITQFK